MRPAQAHVDGQLVGDAEVAILIRAKPLLILRVKPSLDPDFRERETESRWRQSQDWSARRGARNGRLEAGRRTCIIPAEGQSSSRAATHAEQASIGCGMTPELLPRKAGNI